MGLILKKALQKIENDYDYVLIDCPPVIGVLMVNAMAACDRILIPVQTEFLALKGLDPDDRHYATDAQFIPTGLCFYYSPDYV